MELALNYLSSLHRSGYFGKSHKMANGTGVPVGGALLSLAQFNAVRDYLTSNGLLRVAYRDSDEMEREGVHPRDTLDGWWFELTEKGQAFLTSGARMPPNTSLERTRER